MDKPLKQKTNKFKKVIMSIVPPPTKDDGRMDDVISMTFGQLFDLCMSHRWEDFRDNREEDHDHVSDDPEYRKSFRAYFDKLLKSKNDQSGE